MGKITPQRRRRVGTKVRPELRDNLRGCKRFDRLKDREGIEWVVISVHPPFGKRGACLTVLNEAEGWAEMVEVTELEAEGFTRVSQ